MPHICNARIPNVLGDLIQTGVLTQGEVLL